MRRVHLAWAGVLALVLALPAQAQDKKKDKAAKDKLASVLDAAQFLKPGQYDGKLDTVNGSTFILRIEFQRYELKPGAQNSRNTNRQYQNVLRDYNHLAQAQQRLAQARTPAQQMNALHSIQSISNQLQTHSLRALRAAGQQSPLIVKTDHRDFDVEMATNVEVRTLILPFAYDDMGNPKKYTKEELKELKGPNPSVPGYKSDLSALKAEQKVRVTLAKVREKTDTPEEPKKDPEKKDADKKEADKKDPEKKDPEKKDPEKKDPEKDSSSKPSESKLQATRILILEEAPEKPARGGKKK